MNIPQQVSSQVHDETFAGVTYHIRGELVPELQIDLTDARVFFEHHTLLWKQTEVKIEIRKMSGAIKRKIAGGEFFVTRAVGPGRVAFSRDSPGQVLPLHISDGEEIDVEPGGWLYKDLHVKMKAHTSGLRTGLFGGGEKFTWNRFSGPGRVAIQTMYINPAEGDDTVDTSD